ncbi:MAG: hypothetical protein SX243_23105 [Acidobacteriota bacterium]|nr:hypothetical protein [Acidobacteriota bacterium]
MSQRFIEIARFPSRMEAETVGHALDQHGIPFVVQSDDIGIFGPGMSCWTPSGARLLVPESAREEVAGLLTCVVGAGDELDDELLAAVEKAAMAEDSEVEESQPEAESEDP